jgi:circadian clock protein KaiC
VTKTTSIARLATGIRNLDAILNGGWPLGSVTVVAGPPGSGKTVLTQQICFNNVSPKSRVLYFNTLSEPSAKTLRYLAQFAYFDAAKLETDFKFIDLGGVLREKGLQETQALIVEQLKKVKPSVVVIDSFKVFDDLARSHEELRKFGYEVAVNLMAWETRKRNSPQIRSFRLSMVWSRSISGNPRESSSDSFRSSRCAARRTVATNIPL